MNRHHNCSFQEEDCRVLNLKWLDLLQSFGKPNMRLYCQSGRENNRAVHWLVCHCEQLQNSHTIGLSFSLPLWLYTLKFAFPKLSIVKNDFFEEALSWVWRFYVMNNVGWKKGGSRTVQCMFESTVSDAWTWRKIEISKGTRYVCDIDATSVVFPRIIELWFF